ncbi:reverse transcriptase domain-containing protein [Elizabethkingia anophelis]|uniref:RNA-directed DNA polymerase n=1 Tax=Elizabethkingia anophelis TaxID=1117645 RepID=UPI00372EDD72
MDLLKYRLFDAYYNARKSKRNSISQLLFEIDYENNLLELYDDIITGRYKVGRSIAFIVEEPVKREVFAANFRDRVVHHLVYQLINPLLDKQFINDSYSCRKGRGTYYGILRAYENLKEVSNGFISDAYILKLDIQGYFMNINKDILYDKLTKIINEEDFNNSIANDMTYNKIKNSVVSYQLLFELLRTNIYNTPENNCTIKGKLSDWNGLPNSKSLFKSKKGCGLPIGNLTSQLFSNVYLNSFDHYLKNELGVKYYGRYVDDFYIFHRSKNYLKYIMSESHNYLLKEGLELHPKKIYLQHYSKGFQFLGTYIKPHRIYIGKRTARNFKKRIEYYKQVMVNGDLSFNELDEFRSVLNSYLGMLSHYSTYRLRFYTLFKDFECAFYRYGSFSSDLKKFKFYFKDG